MITVSTIVNNTLQKVWDSWTKPEHIIHWNFASPDWHSPYAENDLNIGGKFLYTMAAKDGSFSFDFSGVYTEVITNKAINYTMDDGRIAIIDFEETENGVKITETFEPETENTIELQKGGWQAILDNFRNYAEAV
jgi:uncharacterized protein YndB with AHSA1/START domain